MAKFIVLRFIQFIVVLFGVTLLTFFVMHLAPGDPTSLFIDPNIHPEELARVRANWGLDKPLWIQYGLWVKNTFRGDLGTSYLTGKPVINEIFERLPATILLSASSLFLALIIAVPLGIFSAVHKNTWFDKTASVVVFAGMAIPTFWLALMLVLFFSVKLGWFPSVGMHNPLIKDPSLAVRMLDLARHMFLPLLTTTVVSLAGLSRYQRAAMLEVLKEDYIRTARAKGLPENTVIFKHALRNALLPLITILGLSLPGLFGGAFIIETIFAWPGMGRLGVMAVFSRNYPLIMGIVLFSAVFIILGNFLADLSYALVDPRIKHAKK
jgi:peptide/nickel transport system permease protein